MSSVGITVSPCEDAARIGYDERQINRIVIRMAQYFLDQNMRVIFGHDWRQDGVMRAIADFAETVAAREGSVPEEPDDLQAGHPERIPEPRMLNVVTTPRESSSRAALEAQRDSGGVLALISTWDEFGYLFEFPPYEAKVADYPWGRFRLSEGLGSAEGWTAFRRFITELLAPGCRICLGGRTIEYAARVPGVMEEAELALQYGKPLYLMGGFGGATRIFGARSDFRAHPDYWSTNNGLDGKQKEELFQTTDVERALRLISGGIQTLDHGSKRVAE